MASPAPSKLTYDDYQLIPEDGRRHEIVAGEEYVAPAPRIAHQRVSLRLTERLTAWLRARPAGARPAGELLVAPTDVVLSPTDVVQPDLLFVTAERRRIIGERHVQGAPDLVVEILSEGLRDRDEILKRKRYEHFGVREYWIVDPVLATVKVRRRGASGRFDRGELLAAEAGDVLRSPLLPGLELDLADLFSLAE